MPEFLEPRSGPGVDRGVIRSKPGGRTKVSRNSCGTSCEAPTSPRNSRLSSRSSSRIGCGIVIVGRRAGASLRRASRHRRRPRRPPQKPRCRAHRGVDATDDQVAQGASSRPGRARPRPGRSVGPGRERSIQVSTARSAFLLVSQQPIPDRQQALGLGALANRRRHRLQQRPFRVPADQRRPIEREAVAIRRREPRSSRRQRHSAACPHSPPPKRLSAGAKRRPAGHPAGRSSQDVEATTGFEPVNRGFADLRVEPLHHVARGGFACGSDWMLAAPRGFEPRFTDPKSAVLPLDEGAAVRERRNGAEDGTRTRDPHLGKVMLYQLSHFRSKDPSTRRWCREPDSNWRHRDFQSRALPTELSRPDGQPAVGCPSAGGTIPRASLGHQRNGPLRALLERWRTIGRCWPALSNPGSVVTKRHRAGGGAPRAIDAHVVGSARHAFASRSGSRPDSAAIGSVRRPRQTARHLRPAPLLQPGQAAASAGLERRARRSARAAG